ncbi:hypothetical protein, partial [uncultured Sphaerochaeta sp.]|uniref:hypothetical protein n=1 Tax=uncultured Sphaerochaeta sp. TaxID=886478 RepID=UPI0026267E56
MRISFILYFILHYSKTELPLQPFSIFDSPLLNIHANTSAKKTFCTPILEPPCLHRDQATRTK